MCDTSLNGLDLGFLRQGGHYAIVGLGTSGLSAVKYLYALGMMVSVTDSGQPTLADKLPDDVACYFGGLDENLLTSVDGIVISPGVNPAHPAIVKAKTIGIPVVSDVQLFVEVCHRRNVPIIAITGSNAKSTVTTLVGQMVSDSGRAVGVGGNLGTPALELLNAPLEMAVLELSSFQLEHITKLNATAATILNLSPDHLDRHGDMATYLQAKLAIFDGVQSACLLLDDKHLHQSCVAYIGEHGKLSPKLFDVSSYAPQNEQAFGIIKQNNQLFLAQGNNRLVSADELRIKGVHNLVNALFALALGTAVGLPMASMLATLKNFAGLPHRCEFVKRINQTDYFNDSKGTNVGATVAGMIGLGEVYGEQSLLLILGGQAKGQRFDELVPLVNRYVHSVLTIGEDADKIADDLLGVNVPIVACQTLKNAVSYASRQNAKAVLLSPACASFDQFHGFAHRGEQFVMMVEQLC